MKLKIEVMIIAFLVFFIPFHLSLAIQMGMKNPAAVYCSDLGYEFVVVKSDDGEVGVCRFPDGTESKAWTFLSGQEKREFNYCTRNGLDTKTVSDERCVYNNKCTICVFEDGREEEVTKYMNLKVFANGNEEDNQIDNNITKEDDSLKSYYFLFFLFLLLFLISYFLFKKFIKKKN